MGEITPRGLDVIVSLGERMNAKNFLRNTSPKKGVLSEAIESNKINCNQ